MKTIQTWDGSKTVWTIKQLRAVLNKLDATYDDNPIRISINDEGNWGNAYMVNRVNIYCDGAVVELVAD